VDDARHHLKYSTPMALPLASRWPSLLVVAALIGCGGPTAAGSPSTPVPTASVGPVAPPPPSPPPPAAPATPAPAAPVAPATCAAKCSGHVGNALVSAIGKRAKEAHRCYDKALAADKSVRGKVTIRLMIAADGGVCEVTADADNPGMDAVASCVAALYRTNTGEQRFPPPEDGCASVNAPLSFVPRADNP
jgi:hypothetical protein